MLTIDDFFALKLSTAAKMALLWCASHEARDYHLAELCDHMHMTRHEGETAGRELGHPSIRLKATMDPTVFDVPADSPWRALFTQIDTKATADAVLEDFVASAPVKRGPGRPRKDTTNVSG